MSDVYTEILNLRRSGRPAVLVTVVACQGAVPTELQCKMLVDHGGLIAGTVGGGAIEKLAIADAQTQLAAREPLLKEYMLDDHDPLGRAEPTGMVCGGRMSLFFEILGAGDRVYLFGAGHVNRALRDVLARLDFEITFVDFRPEQLADLDSPHLVAGADYATLPDLPGLAESWVVVATHGHACDEVVLAQLLAGHARPRYLGVVASRRKRTQMLASLRDRLGVDVALDDIHMPVGLHLGGNTPAAVALSIAAEMQAVRSGIAGHVHMRDRGDRQGEKETS